MSARKIKKNPVPDVPKHFNDRNTRDWCRGRKGVEHVKIWKDDDSMRLHHRLGMPWREELVCDGCGKKFSSRTKRYSPGSLIRVMREKADKTQEQVCEETKIFIGRLALIEDDKQQPSLIDFEKLSIALNVRFEIKFAEIPVKISEHEPGGWW